MARLPFVPRPAWARGLVGLALGFAPWLVFSPVGHWLRTRTGMFGIEWASWYLVFALIGLLAGLLCDLWAWGGAIVALAAMLLRGSADLLIAWLVWFGPLFPTFLAASFAGSRLGLRIEERIEARRRS